MNLDKLLVHWLVGLAEMAAEPALSFMKRNHKNPHGA